MTTRLTIVTSLLPPEQGGPALQTYALADFAHQKLVQTEIVLVGNQVNWSVPEGVSVKVCRLQRIVVPGLNYLWALFFAIIYCVRFRPHLVHTQVFGGPGALGFVLAGKLLRIPVYCKVSSERGVDRMMRDDEDVGRKRLLRAASIGDRVQMKLCRRVLATTNAFRRLLQRKYRLPSERIVYFPNFTTIDPQTIAQRNRQLYNSVARRQQAELITVARGIRQKNYGACVAVAEQLQEQGISFRWTFVGGFDSQYKSEIVGQIARRGLENQFFFAGKLPPPEVRQLLASADVFVMLSQFEWFGIAVIEAMAMGVPVFVNRVPGMAEIVPSAFSRVKANQPRDIAARIAKLLTDDDLYYQQAALGRQQVSRHYQVEQTGALLLRWLAEQK